MPHRRALRLDMKASSLAGTAPSSRQLWARVLLAGPLSSLCAALVMAGGALWLPRGAAQIDNLLLPIALFPAIWAALFFYACLERRLVRGYALVLLLVGLHGVLLAAHQLGS